MKPYTLFAAVFMLALTTHVVSTCNAQVVVNGKNLNNDRDLEYIQLMYYIDKSSIKPVFYVDYGFIEPEYTDILDPERPDYQTITPSPAPSS